MTKAQKEKKWDYIRYGSWGYYADVIHFYTFCECIVYEENGDYIKDVINIVSKNDGGRIDIWGDEIECVPLKYVRLLLRRMEDMDDNEITEYYELCKQILHLKNPENDKENILSTVDSPDSFAYCIKNKFDVFNLIEMGFARDVKTFPHGKQKY